MDTKTCAKCKEEVLLTDFSRASEKIDGLQNCCKSCRATMARSWRAKNQEKSKTYDKNWRRKNHEKRLLYERDYEEANREHLTNLRKNWCEANPHSVWKASYKNRSRKAGFEPVTEDFTKAQVVAIYGDKCFHCPAGEFEELDHYPIPVRDGGPHTLENVRPSCTSCNRSANGKRIKWQRK